MRMAWCAMWLLLAAAAADASAQEADRHSARREWLARRRAGELEDTLPAAAAAARRTESRGAATSPATPVSEAAAPHRFAGRFRPNYEAQPNAADLWPLQPLWSGGFGGYGAPFDPWHSPQRRWWASSYTCARVTLSVMPGGRYTLYLFLPPASPYDPAELELLLDRQLSAGQPLQLQSRDGGWIRVQPGSRIESVAISGCDDR